MDEIEDSVDKVFSKEDLHEIVFAVCSTLYQKGIKEVHIGGLMRLLGIDDDQAAQHDDELMLLDEDFERAMREYEVTDEEQNAKIPPGATIH